MKCVFKYKCRVCGRSFDGPVCGDGLAQLILISIAHKYKPPRAMGMMPPELFSIHSAEDHSGIGDLIGYSKEK